MAPKPRAERIVTLAKLTARTRVRTERGVLRTGKPLFRGLAGDVVAAFINGQTQLIPIDFLDELTGALTPIVTRAFVDVAEAVSELYDIESVVSTRTMLSEFVGRTEGVLENRRVRMEIVLDKYQRGDLTQEQAEQALGKIADNDPALQRYAKTETTIITNQGTMDAAVEGGFTHVLLADGSECGLRTHDDSDRVDGTTRTISVFRQYTLAHPNCQRRAVEYLKGTD